MNPSNASSPSNEAGTPAELQTLLRRDAAGEQHELERTWHLAGYARTPLPNAEEIAPAVAAFKIALKAAAPDRPAATRNPVRRRRAGSRRSVALAALILVGASLAWYLFVPARLVAPPGTTTAITLADGSRVVLNSGTVLHHRRGLWGQARAVALTGEAHFEVVPDSRPFVVQTFNAEAQVLGTTFSVRAWPDADVPETTLLVTSGQVRFAPRQTPTRADTLTPGQKSRLVGNADAPTPPALFNADLERLWLDGGLAFIERPLSALFVELERRFGLDIEVASSVQTGDTLTWIQPRLQSAEAALIDICSLSGCRFEQKQGGFRIVGAAD